MFESPHAGVQRVYFIWDSFRSAHPALERRIVHRLIQHALPERSSWKLRRALGTGTIKS
jgi:hypothetical protein